MSAQRRTRTLLSPLVVGVLLALISVALPSIAGAQVRPGAPLGDSGSDDAADVRAPTSVESETMRAPMVTVADTRPTQQRAMTIALFAANAAMLGAGGVLLWRRCGSRAARSPR